MSDEFVKIEISSMDAEYFVAFQRHYQKFKVLCDKGVFDIKQGKAIINFDTEGNIHGVERTFFS